MNKITIDQVISALASDDNVGFCVYCGSEVLGVEPDARNYRCECCGCLQVFGAEEMLLRLDT